MKSKSWTIAQGIISNVYEKGENLLITIQSDTRYNVYCSKKQLFGLIWLAYEGQVNIEAEIAIKTNYLKKQYPISFFLNNLIVLREEYVGEEFEGADVVWNDAENAPFD